MSHRSRNRSKPKQRSARRRSAAPKRGKKSKGYR